jgi:hypothetical protein
MLEHSAAGTLIASASPFAIRNSTIRRLPCWRRGLRSIPRDWGVWSAVQYRSGRSPDWLKMKNSTAPAIIYLSFT